jgi:hypothetical protein
MPFVQLQHRRDISSNWSLNNPILAPGELGIETDTQKIKIGDGTNTWTGITYGGFVGPTGSASNFTSITGDTYISIVSTTGSAQINYDGILRIVGSTNIISSTKSITDSIHSFIFCSSFMSLLLTTVASNMQSP